MSMIVCRRGIYILDSEPKVKELFKKYLAEGVFDSLKMKKSIFVEITDIVEMMKKSKDKEILKLADKIEYLSADAILEVTE